MCDVGTGFLGGSPGCPRASAPAYGKFGFLEVPGSRGDPSSMEELRREICIDFFRFGMDGGGVHI
jgi:hypothetical protein